MYLSHSQFPDKQEMKGFIFFNISDLVSWSDLLQAVENTSFQAVMFIMAGSPTSLFKMDFSTWIFFFLWRLMDFVK